MKYENISKAVRIVKDSVLTPVIYMSEQEDLVEFICFCDGNITTEALCEAEKKIEKALEINAEIIDIRDFSVADRLDIISRCELVYSEHQFLEKVFESAMITDYQRMISEKHSALNRVKECGTFYVQ